MAVLLISGLWLVVVLALLWERRQEALRALQERRELITRIQHPSVIPSSEIAVQEFLLEEDSEYARVGTIQYGGTDD